MAYFETNDKRQLQRFYFWTYGVIEKGLDIKGAWELAENALHNTTLATEINAALQEAKENENTPPITEKERKIKRLDLKRKGVGEMADFIYTSVIDDLIKTDRMELNEYWGNEFTPEEKAENKKRLDELGL